MKAVKVYDVDDVRIEEIRIPTITSREALVKIQSCGICSGDVTPWYIRRKVPLVIGHEPTGIIEAVGEEVDNFSVGERVLLHHHAPCHRCRHCRRGNFTMCETWRESKLDPGGLAEYVRVPEINLRYDSLVLPDSVSFDDGTLIEPLACSVKAIERARIQPGDIVLIIGLGLMGILNGIVARQYGAKIVIGADRIPYRLKKGLEMGLDHVIDVQEQNLEKTVRELTNNIMADTVIVGPGSIPAMKMGLTCVGKGGIVLLFMASSQNDVLDFKPYDLYFRDISIVCSYSCGPHDTRMALDLIESGVVRSDEVITHRFPLSETQRGMELTATAQDSLKVLINVNQ